MTAPTMTSVRIEYHDTVPDAEGRRFYTLVWWSVAQQRERGQVFRSRDWPKHERWARQGHND